jgi:hypothetical protein
MLQQIEISEKKKYKNSEARGFLQTLLQNMDLLQKWQSFAFFSIRIIKLADKPLRAQELCVDFFL